MWCRFVAHSVILNVTATQYTCSFNSVYCPHWLVHWSHHCSCMHIPVHSPWLPGYINVLQTILIILTMSGLFLDRLHIIKNHELHAQWISSVICILYLFLSSYPHVYKHSLSAWCWVRLKVQMKKSSSRRLKSLWGGRGIQSNNCSYS